MTAWLDEALATTSILAADETTTRHHPGIRLQLASAGTPIPMNDLWIAAMARHGKLPPINRDPHSDHVAGITRIAGSYEFRYSEKVGILTGRCHSVPIVQYSVRCLTSCLFHQ